MNTAIDFADPNVLRAALAAGLSQMYADEVPKYGHLVEATNRVNAASQDDRDAGRLGAERHGAVRVASFDELAQLAELFGLFGMEAVGYYDLRTSGTPLPIVATAFRPISRTDIESSPFRMFTSTLVADDERFFRPEVAAELVERSKQRQLFSQALVDLVASSVSAGGVPESEGSSFVELAIDVFRLNHEPIEAAWFAQLDAVSPVASDIAAAAGTHLNHLTPRVVDIVALHGLMQNEGVTMIDRIQGPPSWAGPDVLLRQTSFRALDEKRVFLNAEGEESEEIVRVRFGEVEQRGIALTPQGRAKVDEAMVAGASAADEAERVELIRRALNDRLSPEFATLVADGDAYARYVLGDSLMPENDVSLAGLLALGAIAVQPITYEDFLPASAAGIFASNLAHGGAEIEDGSARLADADRLRMAVGTLHDPYALYAAEQQASLAALGL